MELDYKALKEMGFIKQAQDGYFSLRLKVVGGNLNSSQLSAISDIADKYGNGYAHLTSRQGCEIPFIKEEDIEEIQLALKESGLENGLCGARVRTVTACQGSEVCASGCIETYPLAKEISERYSEHKLPHKFKIGITGCMNDCLKAEENDMGIKGCYIVSHNQAKCEMCGACVKACKFGALSKTSDAIIYDEAKCENCGKCAKACKFGAWDFQVAYKTFFGGRFGNKINKGESVLPILKSTEEVISAADTALSFFSENGNAGERFRVAIDRVGWDKFKEAMQKPKN